MSLESFHDLAMCKNCKKCFDVENVLILLLNTVYFHYCYNVAIKIKYKFYVWP